MGRRLRNGGRKKKGEDLVVRLTVGKTILMWNARVYKRMLREMKKCKYIIAGCVTCIEHVLHNIYCIYKMWEAGSGALVCILKSVNM